MLARHHVPRLCDIDWATRTAVRYQSDRPGELVHVDVEKRGRIPDGGGSRIQGRQISRGSRHKRVLDNDCLHTGHGITIERVMTDNGSCFRSRVFRQAPTDADYTRRRTRPYRPQTNGKAERSNFTLKLECAYAQPYMSNHARLDARDRLVPAITTTDPSRPQRRRTHDYRQQPPREAQLGVHKIVDSVAAGIEG